MQTHPRGFLSAPRSKDFRVSSARVRFLKTNGSPEPVHLESQNPKKRPLSIDRKEEKQTNPGDPFVFKNRHKATARDADPSKRLLVCTPVQGFQGIKCTGSVLDLESQNPKKRPLSIDRKEEKQTNPGDPFVFKNRTFFGFCDSKCTGWVESWPGVDVDSVLVGGGRSAAHPKKRPLSFDRKEEKQTNPGDPFVFKNRTRALDTHVVVNYLEI
jgi:hypothetical protein